MMNSVDKNLQVFLKEHKVNLIAEMTELAEQYHQAHVFFSETNTPKVGVDNVSSLYNQTVSRDLNYEHIQRKKGLLVIINIVF